jgi:hypothetical protein
MSQGPALSVPRVPHAFLVLVLGGGLVLTSAWVTFTSRPALGSSVGTVSTLLAIATGLDSLTN